jgi:hypothetical protein
VKGLYVYALVPRGLGAPLGLGLSDEDLLLLPLEALDAVVGEVDDRPSIAPASLRAHDEVVRRVARASDAILPFRFGAMVTSARELEEGLAPRLDALASALERTRGCDQMTLRIYAAGAEPREAPAAAASPGTRWLRSRAAMQRVPELDAVRDELGPLARAEVVEPHDTPPLRASVFHLVPRARERDYRARVDSLAAKIAPSRVAATGPWPPYAFTGIE